MVFIKIGKRSFCNVPTQRLPVLTWTCSETLSVPIFLPRVLFLSVQQKTHWLKHNDMITATNTEIIDALKDKELQKLIHKIDSSADAEIVS